MTKIKILEYLDPDLEKTLQYAKIHYPHSKDKQEAFLNFVLHSLKHSKEDDENLKYEIKKLKKEVEELKRKIASLK